MVALRVVPVTDEAGHIIEPQLLSAAAEVHRQLRPMLPDDYPAKMARVFAGGARMVVAVNDSVVCLDMVDSTQALRCSFEKGRSVPLRAGASAKCLLAHVAPATRDAILDLHYGADTAERRAALTELEGIAKAGYAVSSGEVDAGVWGVSVPVFGSPRQAAGAITLMAPILRAQGQEAALTGMAVVAAARISRQLTSP